ncbi:MAG: hypothetical protein ABWK53_06715 [Anaerolineales bacterium]
MKRIDLRLLLGSLLLIGGILLLLDTTEILPGAGQYFWAGLVAIAGAMFLFYYFTDRSKWWAAIPGFTLAGLAAAAMLPDRLGLEGLAFLSGIGLGFLAVFASDRRQWWALIPGGVLLTLAAISAMSEHYEIQETGGVFFVGLGLTFVLVAVLANMRWAYIPAGVLLIIGILLGTPFVGVLEYIWIGLLLLGGLALIVSALVQKS